MGLPVLAQSGYYLPGAYLGRLTRPRPTGAVGRTRQPNFLGQGSRLKYQKNVRHVRAFVENESLSFSGVTYRASLEHAAQGDKSKAVLYKSDKTPVPVDKWSFETFVGNGYTQVQISADIYDANASYLIDYQSVDRDVLDVIRFDELREVLFIGDGESQKRYREGIHYRINTTVTQPVAALSNANRAPSTTEVTPDAGNTGDGVIDFNTASSPTYKYNRAYLAEVTAAADAGAAVVTSDGNAGFTNLGTKTLVVKISTDGGATYPTTLTHTFGAGPFANLAAVLADMVGFGAGDITFADDGNGELEITTVATGSLVRVKIDATSTGINGAGLLAFTADQVASGSSTGTIRYTAVALGGGNDSVPDQTVANLGAFSLTFDTSDSSTIEGVDIGHGVLLDLDLSAGNFDVGDKFTFDLLGGARYELEASLENSNQFAAITDPTLGAYSEPTPAAVSAGTGTIEAGTDADYIGTTNRRYELEVVATGGSSGSFTATIRWRSIGELPAATGSISLVEATPASLENVSLELGVKLTFDFGASNFTVGEHFIFEALAPRTGYTGKDDRNVTLTTTAATSGATPTVTFAWVSNTKEGGSGSAVAILQDVATLLRNDLYVRPRNLKQTSTAAYHAAGNAHTFVATNDDTIDWTLQEKVVETIAAADVRFDQTGGVTGTAGLFYVTLDNAPDTIISVRESLSGDPVDYASILDELGRPTTYLSFNADPGVALEVQYLFKSLEPTPGESFFVTAKVLRPETDYDKPIQILSPDDADLKLGPMEPGNHILIAAQLGFEQGMPIAWATQARDRNEDGVIDAVDFKAAIDGSEIKKDISDTIALSAWSVLGYTKTHIEKVNDPFRRAPRMGWFGAPINTPIGDQDTAGSLVYTAKQVLQVFGNSPAHGKFVMVGNTWCKVTVLLPDDSTVQLTLDGSFVAAALAALVASFNDPSETPLKKDLRGFDDIDDYEESELGLLGAAGITTVDVIGIPPAATFRLVESLTTSPRDDSSEISWITQDEAVVRTVNDDLEQVVGAVVPTGAEGADQVGNVLVVSLARLAGNLVAPYQDENGAPRKVDRKKDIIIERDPNRKTRYNYLFGYFRRNPVKYVNGLYVTDVSDVTTLIANT